MAISENRPESRHESRQDKPASTQSALVSWVLPILINIVAPIVTYSVLAGAGMDDVPALLISGIWPLVEMAVTYRAQRHLDEFAVFVLIGLVAGILTTVFSGDSRAVFLKDSITSGVIGLAFLVTLPWKPLTFFLGRRFATDGSKVQRDWWDGLWAHERFRMIQRRLGAAWGIVLVVESAIRAVLTYQLGTTSMVVVNTVVPYLVIAVMIGVSVATGKREQRLAEERGFSTAVAPPTEQPA